MADLVTKLILDNSDFVKNIKMSKNEVQMFKDMGTKVTGMLKTLAGGFAVAVTANEIFDRTMRGSQTTSDAWDSAIRACTTSVDSFFTAVSTGDFSVFFGGLDTLIDKAYAANAALDQLGNTVISFDYLSSKNNAEFGEQINTLRDKNATEQQKANAKQKADEILAAQKEYAETLGYTVDDAVKKLVTETNILKSSSVSMGDVEKIMKLDVSKDRDNEKASLGRQYEEFLSQLREMKDSRKYNTKVNITTRYNRRTGEAYEHRQNVFNTDEKDVQELANKYKDAILYNEMLVKKNDDWLKDLTATMQKSSAAQMSVNSMERMLNRTSAKVSSTSTPKGQKQSTIKKEDIQLPSFDKYDDVQLLDADRNSRSINDLKEEIKSLDEQINKTTDDAERMNLINRKEGLENVINQKLGKVEAKVETKVETKLLFDDGSLNYLMEQERKLIDEFNAAQSDEDRAKIYAELVLIKKKKKDMDLGNNDEQDQKSEGQKAAESWAEGYATSMGQMDWSTKEGRQAVAQQTIDSIKALIIARAIESAMKLPFPANIIAAPIAATAVAGLFSMIPKFEEGGVVGGNSEHGDKILARVNSGEMILNKQQQSSLYNIINEGNNISSNVGYFPNNSIQSIQNNNTDNAGNKVEFKIKGRELVGVLHNYNNKVNKVI